MHQYHLILLTIVPSIIPPTSFDKIHFPRAVAVLVLTVAATAIAADPSVVYA